MKLLRISILMFCLFIPIQANATDVKEEIESKYDFTEIDEMLDEMFPNDKLNFKDTVLALVSGDMEFSLDLIGDMIGDQLFYELNNSKSGMIQILILVIIASIFANFSDVFKSTQVAEISFSMLYMFLITICLNNFRMLIDVTTANVEHLINFMELLGPIYFLAVAIAKGSSTSITFYQLVLLLIFIIEIIICKFLIPMIQIYMVVKILDEFSPGIRLSKFAELIETIVAWALKTLIAVIVGLNIMQGMLAPAIDSVKRSILTKGGEAIPIVGDAIGGTAEVMLATANLIKNGIGAAGMIVCIIVCLVPIIKIAIIALLYQVVAALIQPISDKRMVNCVGSMADGTKMLLRIVTNTGLLFMITIAIVATISGG